MTASSKLGNLIDEFILSILIVCGHFALSLDPLGTFLVLALALSLDLALALEDEQPGAETTLLAAAALRLDVSIEAGGVLCKALFCRQV